MRGKTIALCAAAAAAALYTCAAPRAARGSRGAAEAPSRPANGGMLGFDRGGYRANDGRAENADARVTTATFGPKRARPVFTGPFTVSLVIVNFPDCKAPPVEEIASVMDRPGGYTLKEYFDKYSHGVTWPVLQAFPAVYKAQEPLGYYCRFDTFTNPVGFRGGEEGASRAKKLRDDALAFAKAGSPRVRQGQVLCYVFCNELDTEAVSRLLRPHFPEKPDGSDPTTEYKPSIPWADPLWPVSIVQVLYPDGGALVHELGHVLGAPDFYHASTEHDGVTGTPCLPWAYGPTGPAYCRYIYQALVPKETYPTFSRPGTYTLDRRDAQLDRSDPSAPPPVLGCFIPSAHPNYMFCLEYAKDEKPPVGIRGADGLLVSVINVTMASPMMGPPDLCYTYRRGDRYMKGRGEGDPFLHAGDSFTLRSDPAAILPPLIPAGIEITDIKEEDGRCTFTLDFPKVNRTPKYLKDALLPKIRLLDVGDVLPHSMHPSCDVVYRGEPHLDEYGFVWDVAKSPTLAKNRYPLYHRERCDAQIYGLKPGTKYYVRAYAKSPAGVTYSKREIEVTTPREAREVAPLLVDDLHGRFFITRWFFANDSDGYFNSASAVISLMSLGVYYGTVPGGASRGAKPLDVRKVHTAPSDSCYQPRLSEFGQYVEQMKRVAEESGLRDHKFGKMPDWQKKCARGLKIKDPAKAFVHTPNTASLKAAADRIRASLENSRPVMLIRQNDYMPNVTETIYPLDIALIDGIGADGSWHVTFPLGSDRGTDNAETGYVSAEKLMVSVQDACLLFYCPLDR